MGKFPTITGEKPKIIAHRGASGYLPEHTLEAYALAIDLGCDMIEPDLVFSKDGELIVRHDIYLSTTTDVADHPEFSERKRTHKLHKTPDWFVEDFSVEELKTLKARQAFPGRSKDYDGKFDIITFDEAMALLKRKSAEKKRPIGVCPEVKKPGYYLKQGFNFIPPLLETLQKYEYGGEGNPPVFILSFDPRFLMRIARRTDLPLIFNLEDDFRMAFLLKVIAHYVQGIGPDKSLLVRGGKTTGLLEKAHRAGLKVFPFAFRDDKVGPGFDTPEAELKFYLNLGADAVFTDFTDTGKVVRDLIP